MPLNPSVNIREGRQLHDFVAQLFPICRSITGEGVRETLRRIAAHIPIRVHEVSSGTTVFDWTVPLEWNIRDAYVKDARGRKIIDFRKSNLHVVSYSAPVHRTVTLAELKKHVYTLPDDPDAIPYVTSYYKEQWGFCMTHTQYAGLREGAYEVMIDATLAPGSLTYGELLIPGARKEEVVISTYVCHPSLCNDNLSGVALATFLAKRMMRGPKKQYSYRFLFIPETIGAITWLCRNEKHLSRIAHGLVATCVGDAGPFTYKRTWHGDRMIDRAALCVLRDAKESHTVIDFDPVNGSDERQFASPAFRLPFGSLMRTPYAKYPAYHTSADNLSFISPEGLYGSLLRHEAVIDLLEHNRVWKNCSPKGEPQLGKRGLYRHTNVKSRVALNEEALFWMLNFSDGAHDVLAIAEKSGIAFRDLAAAAEVLAAAGLLSDEGLSLR